MLAERERDRRMASMGQRQNRDSTSTSRGDVSSHRPKSVTDDSDR